MLTPRARLHAAALALALVAAPLVTTARAQVLAGTVLHTDSTTPAHGVLVEVRRAGARESMRVLTTESGTFRLALPSPDTVRVRVLRPGFRPVVMPPVFVAASATRALRIVLRDEQVTLSTVTVRESRVCGERADAAAWQLWEQARTALQTTALTERDTSLRVRTVEFQGTVTRDGATVVHDSTIRLVPVDAEFPRAHYDSLFRLGYIRQGAHGITTYYAPNAKVLLDERFVLSHCFRVAGRGATAAGLVGVRFEPAGRTPRTDITGTFWLDSSSFLLRQIDFAYVNPPLGHRISGLGGFVLFTRLATGHWIMHEWQMRMRGERRPWSRNQIIVDVRRGDELLFHSPEGDSLSARRVRFDGSPPPDFE